MGDLVPLDGGRESGATASQALFGAIVDYAAEMFGGVWPRSQIAIAVRHGKAALEDGIEPEIVLQGCVFAMRRGQPQLAGRLILDVVNSRLGASITYEQWRNANEESASLAAIARKLAERDRLRLERGQA